MSSCCIGFLVYRHVFFCLFLVFPCVLHFLCALHSFPLCIKLVLRYATPTIAFFVLLCGEREGPSANMNGQMHSGLTINQKQGPSNGRNRP